MDDLDIIIPVWNEDAAVVRDTIVRVRAAMAGRAGWRIIIVDDGSRPEFNLAALSSEESVTVVHHGVNRGYGAALKTGILTGAAGRIAIIDADATYPPERLPDLVDAMAQADMVVGVRTSDVREIPWLRRFPKWVLNQLASYMASRRIVDLNSGMRVFTRPLVFTYWGLLPTGFSFTSTITMGSIMGGYRVKDIPIDYFKRVGSSSIKPIRDTIRFTRIILRLGGLFNPTRVFWPIAGILAAAGASKALFRDLPNNGAIGNLSAMLMLAALQVFLLGYLAELIAASRHLSDGRKAAS